jgi:TM2 domain-containing membrane protein YozV
MKTKTSAFMGLIIVLSLASSCSITKMRYSKGCNIQLWDRWGKEKINITHKPNSPKSQEKKLKEKADSIIQSTICDGLGTSVEGVKSTETKQTGTILLPKSTKEKPALSRPSGKKQNKDIISFKRIALKENNAVSTYSKTAFHQIDAPSTQHPEKVNDGQSWLIALILCIFLGYLGIHRFYLGYPVIGIIQLLTLGFFGLWWLIDIILILIGHLKPKKGDYVDH